jgi:hypothetical protein
MDKRQENMVKEFLENKTDEERWAWVINNKNKGIIVLLDNDTTHWCFENNNDVCYKFDRCIGYCTQLLDCLGIDYEVA